MVAADSSSSEATVRMASVKKDHLTRKEDLAELTQSDLSASQFERGKVVCKEK